jgi:ATP-dependent RNA helicase DDX5/DBP2
VLSANLLSCNSFCLHWIARHPFAHAAMPYVPPHLRGAGAQDKAPPQPPSSTTRSSSFNDLASHDRGNSSGRFDAPRRGAGLNKTPSTNNIDGLRGSGRRTNQSAEVVIGTWQPSERVQALNEEQIADIRQRLNVDVEVPPDEPPAAAPIESFLDMVSAKAEQRHSCEQWRYHGAIQPLPPPVFCL